MRPDDLEDLSRRAARSQNQIDPSRLKPSPWFVGANPRLMRIVVSIIGLLIAARIVSTVWLAQEAWKWWHRPSSVMRPSMVERGSSWQSGIGKPLIADGIGASTAYRAVPPADRALAGAKLKGNPARWFGDDAYPASAIRAGEQGRTVARLGIDASGTPVSCAIVKSSGSRSLDARTCTIALGRIQFDPPRDGQGRPVPSSFTLPVRWVLPAN